MKKTLLLAAALACSGVAQAEIYTCTSTTAAVWNTSGFRREIMTPRTWIVDSTKGVRYPTYEGTASEYTGKCKLGATSEIVIFCTAERSDEHSNIRVRESVEAQAIIFSASELNDFGVIHVGKCIKI